MTRFSNLAVLAALSSMPMYADRRLVVSIAERKLALVVDGEVKKVYAVAVGKPSTPSPSGTFTIIARVPNPTWYGPGKVVGPGKQNPLGTRWMGLSQKGYGVHGTSAPNSIGKAASHGCIRMRNADAEELFELVQTGDTVELISERNDRIAALFTVQPANAPKIESAPAGVQLASTNTSTGSGE